jgi:carboxylesterase
MVLVDPKAQSFLLTGHKDTACLFIHGFTASPSEVYPVARLIYEMTGVTVSGPLLPGHGTTPQHMNQTAWQDWYGRVLQELEYLQKKHNRVFLIGLSMGGLLALHAASKVEGLPGVIAINTPIFTTSPRQMSLTTLLQYIKPYYPKRMDQNAKELEKEGRFAYPVMPVKSLLSMRRLGRIVMREIPSLNIPVLLFQSGQDESVDPRSAQYIKEKAAQTRVKLVELKDSGHIATMGPEKQIIAQEIAEFIRKQGDG